jgi:hypothetical protein
MSTMLSSLSSLRTLSDRDDAAPQASWPEPVWRLTLKHAAQHGGAAQIGAVTIPAPRSAISASGAKPLVRAMARSLATTIGALARVP